VRARRKFLEVLLFAAL